MVCLRVIMLGIYASVRPAGKVLLAVRISGFLL